jgi:SHS2 domain-containing protein
MDNLKRYRITPHQSELAVKVFGSSQVELFQNSGWALFDVITDIEKIENKDSVPLEVEGTDRDDLLVNWVREFLYLYQGSGYLLKEFRISELGDKLVKAKACGEKIDPDRHEIKREVVAIAYDKSRMVKTGDQWTAQLIFEV